MDRSIDSDLRGPEERESSRERPNEVKTPQPAARLSAEGIAQLRSRIDATTEGQPTISEWIARLERIGIRAVPSLQKNGRLNGMSYVADGIYIRGSEIGRAYTAQGLQKYRGIRYDPIRDHA